MIDYLNQLLPELRQTWPPARQITCLSWVLTTNGGAELHDNVVFLGLPRGKCEPVLVAKTCRWPDFAAMIVHEYKQLTAVWQLWGEKAEGRIPRPLHLGQRQQDWVMLTDFFSGEMLSHQVRRLAPVASHEAEMEAIFCRCARWLRHYHQATAIPHAGIAEPKPSFAAYAALFAQMFTLSAKEQAALAALVRHQATLTQTAVAQVLLHGDFWPGNLLVREPNAPLALIDWQFAHWSSEASLDLYFLPLASSIGLVPYGPSEQRGQAALAVVRQWQERLLPAYIAAYGQPEGYGLLPLWEGMLACCVTAVARPQHFFGRPQSDALIWRTLFAGLMQHMG